MPTAVVTPPPSTRPAPAAAPFTPTPAATYPTDPSLYRFTVAQYQEMVTHGILTANDKVELLEGIVVNKMARNPPHDGTIQYIAPVFYRVIPVVWSVRCQLTLVLPDSQPEPDFTLARGDARAYLQRHPTPADVALVVEVANTSLLRDRQEKGRIYARGGVGVYWIINLVDRRVEVYTQPSGPTAAPAFGSVQTFGPGDTVSLALDGTFVTIPVNDLLP